MEGSTELALEQKLLMSRVEEYRESLKDSDDSFQMKKGSALSRNKVFLKCSSHDNGKLWTSENDACSDCEVFHPTNRLPNGRLPLLIEVINLILFNEDLNEIVWKLVCHWTLCNVYPMNRKAIRSALEKYMKEFNILRKYPMKKKGKTYWERVTTFLGDMHKIFDIKADEERVIELVRFWDVKNDTDFYNSQCLVPQKGYCDMLKVDAKWEKTFKRKVNDKLMFEKSKEREKNSSYMLSVSSLDIADELDCPCPDSSDDFIPDPENEKYQFNSTLLDEPSDDMPYRFRHIRHGPHSVRPEYYLLTHQLKSELHMSEAQAQGAIIAVANTLFGRKEFGEWKPYHKGQVADYNTLPAPTNINRTEPYVEAMVLAGIVSEIMSPESEKTVVTYSNDGSGKSGVGKFIVQSFLINGKQRALPTMPIFTESRATLADLEKTTLKILSHATGNKYSPAEILERIDFVMTDSTLHNIGVIDEVCNELDVESVPMSLVCNVHPALMMQGKVKEVYKEIHNALGPSTIKDCFLVNIDFHNDTIFEKAMHCFANIVSSEYSEKPWNRHSEFCHFIKPKRNMIMTLRESRFNRIFDSALSVLYHIDDIKLFLEKFQNIMNEMAILNRNFLDMELFKPVLSATALIGVHIGRPFLSLLLDKETTYETLIKAFPTLYTELVNLNYEQFLQTDEMVCKFVTEEKFKKSLPENCLLESLQGFVSHFRKDVLKVIQIIIPRIAEGFAIQRGAIFGFGAQKDEDTGKIFKISTANEAKRQKLNQAPVHNLNEERSVGWVNQELDVRGKCFLESVSKKLVINKGIDLINEETLKLSNFRKPAKEIKEAKLQWSLKVKEQLEKGFTDKEVANLKQETTKYNLL